MLGSGVKGTGGHRERGSGDDEDVQTDDNGSMRVGSVRTREREREKERGRE